MDFRALVVCPDQDSSVLLKLLLSEMGISVEHTPSLSRGLDLLESERFDAIVLDYRADQSSEEFLSRFRQSPKNRSTMLIAIVENGFNSRPIFGLGANFVLYRPLSSERTRISLRAARGLMRRERRSSTRTSLSSTVNVSYPGAIETCGVLADLSDGGTLIHTANRIPPACKVYFEFALPGQTDLVRLSGEVAWQDASGRTGIRFLDVPQPSRHLMQEWMDQNSGTADSRAIPMNGKPLSDELVGQALPANQAASEPPASEFRWVERGAEDPWVDHQAIDDRPIPDEPREKKYVARQVAHTSVRPAQQVEMKRPGLVPNAGNRRGERRMPCALGAEVYSVGSTVPNRCSLSDISEGGCYVEMPSPLSGQSGVDILVRTADTKVKIRGQVITSHPGFGMGVRFILRDSMEREKILRLLAILSAGPSLDEQLR
jgi:CheY-like chemotaxis protein